MYYGIYEFFYKLFLENKDAILSLPTEVKTIIAVSLVISIVCSLAKKAMRLLEIMVFVAFAYMLATYFGFI